MEVPDVSEKMGRPTSSWLCSQVAGVPKISKGNEEADMLLTLYIKTVVTEILEENEKTSLFVALPTQFQTAKSQLD